MSKEPKLRRVVDGSHWFGGVCGGIAYYLEAPVWLVRLIFVLIVLVTGVGWIPYVLLWMLLPAWQKTPKDFYKVTGD